MHAPRFSGARHELVQRLYPGGVPALWCPPLTHFREDGSLDRERIRAHLRFMQPAVRGFLVPAAPARAGRCPTGRSASCWRWSWRRCVARRPMSWSAC